MAKLFTESALILENFLTVYISLAFEILERTALEIHAMHDLKKLT